MTTGHDANLDLEVNFGGNQRWYTQRYQPSSEADVLDILARHAQSSIRVLGSKHSWSGIAADADVALDMSRLDSVEPIKLGDAELVRVGAGCRLKDLIEQLHSRTDRTLPTLGAITKQTISGAISTGTHGSGRQSLSHFVAKVRAAVFNPATGAPEIREFSGGPELLAARCGLGCMGVILSVDLHTVPKFRIAETVRIYQNIDDILRTYAQHPLTQFLLTPYSCKWVVFERAPVGQPQQGIVSRIKARFFRLSNLIGVDIGFHLGVIASRFLGAAAVRGFYHLVPRLMVKNVERIDHSHHVLTMKHNYFRHEEMELFVRQSDLPRTMAFLRAAIDLCAGAEARFPDELAQQLKQSGCYDQLVALRGSYLHHYPLFCRRVMPEDTMISMAASADEPFFSISIFTYDPAGKRSRYYAFCAIVARTLLALVNARLHWGKHFPLQYADIAPLYPRLDEFRALASTLDPGGVLRNGYTTRVLALPRGPRGAPASGVRPDAVTSGMER
jgi:hypothetical protein